VSGPVVFPAPDDYAKMGLSDGGPVLRFDRCETEVTGRKLEDHPRHEVHETVIRKTVTNLNILNRLTASIGVEIKSTYTRRPTTPAAEQQRDRVEVKLTITQPFIIDTPGVVLPIPLPNPIVLNTDIPASAGEDFKRFLQAGTPRISIDLLRPYPQHHKHEHGGVGSCGHGHGLIHTALAEPAGEGSPFTYSEQTLDFGRFDVPVPNVGDSSFAVYVGEWSGQPYRQSLSFLRVQLKNVQDRLTPKGTFSGAIIIDDETNGCPIP
jgi:hypothetical protein